MIWHSIKCQVSFFAEYSCSAFSITFSRVRYLQSVTVNSYHVISTCPLSISKLFTFQYLKTRHTCMLEDNSDYTRCVVLKFAFSCFYMSWVCLLHIFYKTSSWIFYFGILMVVMVTSWLLQNCNSFISLPSFKLKEIAGVTNVDTS